MDRLDAKPRSRDVAAQDAEPALAGVTPRQVERALVGLAHRLSGAGYGVLIWDRPGSAVDPTPVPKT